MPGVPVSYITPDQFKRWKEQKDLEKEQEKVLAERERQDDINNGKASLTGRELYEKHPELFEDY